MTATPIRLYGSLGTRFGREHSFHLDSKTPAEALSALFSQVKGARDYFANAHKQGIRFAVFVGKRNLSRDHLSLPANDVIRIAPVLAGSKRSGVLSVILGAVLVVVGIYGNVTGGWGTPFIQAGIAMIAGGVIQMLTPMPHGRSSQDRGVDSESSYNFNGPVNTQAQGNPVPLAYGDVFTGSAVISAGIDTVDTVVVPWRGGTNPKQGDMGGGGMPGPRLPVTVRPGAG